LLKSLLLQEFWNRNWTRLVQRRRFCIRFVGQKYPCCKLRSFCCHSKTLCEH